MTNTIKINSKFITVNGVRAGVRFDAGPWIEGVPADMIKIRCKKGLFPAEIRKAFTVENNSDSREDYFENDSIRIYRNHPLYKQIKEVAA